MKFARLSRSIAPAVLGLIVGFSLASGKLIVAQSSPARVLASPQATSTYTALNPAFRGLDANLWMQTSAEYRACCYQAFNLAKAVMDSRRALREPGDKPAAVVLDLDETVFDNSQFQATLVRRNIAYDAGLWRQWQESLRGNITLIPGALEFIQSARAAGVKVFYIGNTLEDHRETIKGVLADFNIPLKTEDELKLKAAGPAGTDDKTARRKEITDSYKVLLFVGDNLRDFDESFAFAKKTNPPQSPAERVDHRKKTVDDRRQYFGSYYIVLPNTAYGEWTKAFGQDGTDVDLLAPAMP